jgi:hypothetical protein
MFLPSLSVVGSVTFTHISGRTAGGGGSANEEDLFLVRPVVDQARLPARLVGRHPDGFALATHSGTKEICSALIAARL